MRRRAVQARVVEEPMRGRAIPLSPVRKLVVDLTHFHVPSVPVQRVMHLGPLVTARAALNDRPVWAALFAKAYALTAREIPQLRQAYVKVLWPHLYEYPRSTLSMVFERDHHGEMVILTTLLRAPEDTPISALSDTMKRIKDEPIESNRDFRRMFELARWPMPLRRLIWWLGLNIGRQRGNYFGTFGITVYSGLGAESLHPISPLTAVLNYGVIDKDGAVAVRIMYDHRVLDGSMVARALEKIEQKLLGEVLSELKALPSPASAPSTQAAAPRR
jgi:hypothetical protein